MDAEASTPEPITSRRLSRRTALGLGAGALGAAALGVAGWSRLVAQQRTTSATTGTTTSTAPAGNGRVLVVVQCNGGNDGLNTLVPVDGRYHDLRPNLGLADDQLQALIGESRFGLHPSLAPLVPLWEAGNLAALVPAGFDGQSRSHFAARDLWWSATPGKTTSTGWLGRWLDQTGDNPLRAVSLGSPAPALIGEKVNATFVGDPAQFRLLTPKGATDAQLAAALALTAQPLSSDAFTASTQQAVPEALDAARVLASALPDGTASNADQIEAGSVHDLLTVAAGLLELDVGTEVIVVAREGFDTHSGQADTQAELLGDLASGISSFLGTVAAQGRGDDVLVVTTSEFGRRASENGSAGTDHGNGNTLFACGPGVHGGVVGEVDLGALDQGDLPSTIDARSLYAVGLDWLGGGDVDSVLTPGIDRYGLLTA